MTNLKAQGFILIVVDVAALNNAVKNTPSTLANAAVPNRIFKDGKSDVYVSGYAWPTWWRDLFQ